MYVPGMTMRDIVKQAYHPNNNVRRGESQQDAHHGHSPPPNYQDQVYHGGFGHGAPPYGGEEEEQDPWQQPASGGMLNWGNEAGPESEREQEADPEQEAEQKPEYDPGGLNRFVLASVTAELFPHVDPPDMESLLVDNIRAEMDGDPDMYQEQEMGERPERDLEGVIWCNPFQ